MAKPTNDPIVDTEPIQIPMPDGMVKRRLNHEEPTEEDRLWEAANSGLKTPEHVKQWDKARQNHLKDALRLEQNIRRWKNDHGIIEENTDAPTNRFQLMRDIKVQPPEPPWLGIIASQGATLLHGRGGTGKGSLAAHLVLELIREKGKDFHALIIDAERRTYEWKPRFDAMGATTEEQAQIGYYTPASTPIWEQINEIREDLNGFTPDIVVVDSVARACVIDSSTGDTSVPVNYYNALDQLAPRHLSIAHNNKSGDLFGSQRWYDDARISWSFGAEADTRVLTNNKHNAGPQLPPHEVRVMKWTNPPMPMPAVMKISAYNESLAVKIHRIVLTPMTYAQIELALLNETQESDQEPIKMASIRQAVKRGVENGTLIKSGPKDKPLIGRNEPYVSHEQVELPWQCAACHGYDSPDNLEIRNQKRYHKGGCPVAVEAEQS